MGRKPENPPRRLTKCKAADRQLCAALKTSCGAIYGSEGLMILRAAVLSGFLLLSEVAFAQRPHENGSPPPPPPTATSSPNPSPSPIAPHSTSSGISPTTGPFSPPAHGSNASPPAGNAGHARKSAWQENGIGVFPRTGGDPNPLRLKREPLPDLMPKHCKREPCTQPPPTHPVGGNAQPAPPRAAAAPAQRCPPGQTPQGGDRNCRAMPAGPSMERHGLRPAWG